MEVGGFRLGRELGTGEVGTWYEAEHAQSKRAALVKVMRPELTRPDAVARFAEDIRTFSLLAHPALAHVLDAGVHTDGRIYVAIEKIGGETLSARLARGGALPEKPAMGIARQVAHALGAAHVAGLAHLDLRPSNLMVSGDGERACVLDFAVARLAATSDRPAGSRDATYLAPEQVRGANQVDHRADIYALGCILFEMLAGKPPYADAAGHLYGEVPALPDGTTPALAALVKRMLAKEPGERVETMEHVIQALDELGAPRGAAPAQALDQANAVRGGAAELVRAAAAVRKQAAHADRRRTWWLAGATAVALSIVVAGAVLSRASTGPASVGTTCAGGDGLACYTEGLRARDEATRKQHFGRACAGGYGPGCTAAGVVADAKAADALFRKACDLGDGQGCIHLARRHEADATRAETYYRRGCEHGAAAACTRLGEIYVADDPLVGAGYLQRGCDGNDGAACHRLARLYRVGTGVDRDPGKAAMLAQRACALEASLCARE